MGPGMREEGMRARFPHSDLSDEVAAFVFIPRDASRDPEDEWHFEDAEAGGRLAWGLSPPEPSDATEAAASLKRLARACLRRVAANAGDAGDEGACIEPAPGAHRSVLLELLRSARDATGRDEENAQYLILTAALSVIERRCVDLYRSSGEIEIDFASMDGRLRDDDVTSASEEKDERNHTDDGTTPNDAPLLSETIASRRLANAVVRGCSLGSRSDAAGEKSAGATKKVRSRDPLWPLRRFLHPRCVNARNVAWHGFLAPRDVSPELAALALAMACSLPGAGDASAEKTSDADAGGRLPRRERNKDEKRLERCDAEMLAARPTCLTAVGFSDPEDPTDAARTRTRTRRAHHLEVIRASSFFPPGWRESVAAAAGEFLSGDPPPDHWKCFRFVAVVAPAVEHALRFAYAEANGAPEVVTARLGEYYATLDGYGQARAHDVLLHPRRAELKNGGGANAFPATLRGETLAALEDLFMRDRGPSLRAAYAHGGTRLLPEDPRKTTDDAPTTRFSSSRREEEKGEEASEGSEGSIRAGKSRGACAATLLAAALDLCDCPASPLRGYSSVFHPRARLRDAVRAATEATATVAAAEPRFALAFPGGEEGSLVTVLDGGVERVSFSSRRDSAATAATAAKDEAALLEMARLAHDAWRAARPGRRDETLGRVAAAFLDRDAPPERREDESRDDNRLRSRETGDDADDDVQFGINENSGSECLRAAAEEVRAAATAHVFCVERLLSAAETREARGGHRKQLVAAVSSTRALAASLLATLLLVDVFSHHEATVRLLDADDDRRVATGDGRRAPGAEAARSIRARLLTQATAARVLCESGRTREAARAAAAGWTQRAGRETASALLRMTYGDI